MLGPPIVSTTKRRSYCVTKEKNWEKGLRWENNNGSDHSKMRQKNHRALQGRKTPKVWIKVRKTRNLYSRRGRPPGCDFGGGKAPARRDVHILGSGRKRRQSGSEERNHSSAPRRNGKVGIESGGESKGKQRRRLRTLKTLHAEVRKPIG